MNISIPIIRGQINELMVFNWYSNLYAELQCGGYTEKSVKLINDPKNYYGLFLNRKTVNYFRIHFVKYITACLNYLFSNNDSNLRILDLGCGCGCQSLLMALLGAEVVGVDSSQDAIDVCNERKSFYEKRLGKELAVSFINADAFALTKDSIGQFNGIYSLFAIQLMKPYDLLLKKIADMMLPHCKVTFQNSNPSHFYRRMSGADTISLNSLSRMMAEMNILCVQSYGTTSLPGILWNLPIKPILRFIDRSLSKSEQFSFSYVYMGEYRE